MFIWSRRIVGLKSRRYLKKWTITEIQRKFKFCIELSSNDWEQRKLEDIIEKLTGGASIAPDDYVDAGYRTIPKGAVNSSGIADMSGCKIVSEDFYK